jgi:uncharacterized membrane protein YdjX (TVP38/TMEM64 family)
MKKHPKNIIALLVLIAVIVGIRLSGISDYLTLETLQKNRDALLALVRERYVLSVILYIAVYIAAVALNLPGGAVLTLAGGYLFGTVAAVVFVNIGATIGAVLAFLTARYLLGRRIQESYAVQLAKFNKEMDRNGMRYLLTMRLIPVFPFFLVNFLSGLTRVPLATFLWTTAVGIIPATAVFAYAGQQLGTVRSAGDILSPRILAAFIALALFVLFPALRTRFRKNP